jgi:hypothetical protein
MAAIYGLAGIVAALLVVLAVAGFTAAVALTLDPLDLQRRDAAFAGGIVVRIPQPIDTTSSNAQRPPERMRRPALCWMSATSCAHIAIACVWSGMNCVVSSGSCA